MTSDRSITIPVDKMRQFVDQDGKGYDFYGMSGLELSKLWKKQQKKLTTS